MAYNQLADCSENDQETSSSTQNREFLSLLGEHQFPYE